MLLTQLLVIGLLQCVQSTKPPGYVEKPKIPDPNPPNYDFGYTIADSSGNTQGHLEHRNGEHTKGHYYVDLPKESTAQEVRYLADDWGFHPLVKYSSKSKHSSSSTQLALGEEAIKELAGDNNRNTAKNSEKIMPLLAKTVLPTGTSTTGFIHHNTQNGIQTLHPLPTQSVSPDTIQKLQPINSNPPNFINAHPTNTNQYFIPTILTPTHNDQSHHNQNVYISPNGGVQYSSNVENQHSKSSVKFERGDNKLKSTANPNAIHEFLPVPEKLIDRPSISSADDSILSLGGYGSKLISKTPKPIQHFVTTTQAPLFSPHKPKAIYSKLVASTQNLVSNEDLLKINGAAETSSNPESPHIQIDHVFDDRYVNRHDLIYDQPYRQTFTLGGSFGGNSKFKKPNGAGIIAIETDESENQDGFSAPIVVADINPHNDVTISSTTESNIHHNENLDNNLYSTTHSTIEVNHDVHNSAQSDKSANVPFSYRQKPVHLKFLAPLTAGLRLVNSNKVDYLDCPDKVDSTEVKHVEDDVIEQENIENENGLKTVVELFRSTPIASNIHIQQPSIQDTQQNQFHNALDSSKKIQESSNQQLYQLGAQQVLIHPTEQISQFAAEELAQQAQEHDEEAVKQESSTIQQSFNEQHNANIVIHHDVNNVHGLQYVTPSQQSDQHIELHHEESKQDYNTYSNSPLGHNYPSNANVGQQFVFHNPGESNNNGEITKYETDIQHTDSKNEFSTNSFSTNFQINHNENNNHHAKEPEHHYESTQAPIIIEKPVPYRVEVEKIVEKPIPYPYEVEVPIPITTKVPVPYPVEKRVPYPVEVEKIIDRPVEVTKYVNNPYPVEVRVPHPIPIHIHHAYPVDRIVQKNVPYPVEVEKIVEKKVPVEVRVPYPVEKIVEKVVETPVPVPQYIEKLYPVPSPYPYPVEVERVVEKKVPYPVEVPYRFEVSQPIFYEKAIKQESHGNIQQVQLNQHYAIAQYNPWQYGWVNGGGGYIDTSKRIQPATTPIKYPPIADSYIRRPPSSYSPPHPVNQQQYYGPVPLKDSFSSWNINDDAHIRDNTLKYRRSDRGGKGLRLEYGFKPPLIPSIEIDMDGQPVKRNP